MVFDEVRMVVLGDASSPLGGRRQSVREVLAWSGPLAIILRVWPKRVMRTCY